MAYEELFLDLLRAEREEDVTDVPGAQIGLRQQ